MAITKEWLRRWLSITSPLSLRQLTEQFDFLGNTLFHLHVGMQFKLVVDLDCYLHSCFFMDCCLYCCIVTMSKSCTEDILINRGVIHASWERCCSRVEIIRTGAHAVVTELVDLCLKSFTLSTYAIHFHVKLVFRTFLICWSFGFYRNKEVITNYK